MAQEKTNQKAAMPEQNNVEVKERKTLTLMTVNEKGEPAVIVTEPKETSSGSGYNCRLKFQTGQFFNGIFDKKIDITNLHKGSEIIIYSFDLVAINKQSFDDYIYLHFVDQADFEVTKVGTPAPASSTERNNRRNLNNRDQV